MSLEMSSVVFVEALRFHLLISLTGVESFSLGAHLVPGVELELIAPYLFKPTRCNFSLT